jgi:hypothetical protein
VIQNKTDVLNLKTRKTQVPMGYLTLKLIKLALRLKPQPCLLGSCASRIMDRSFSRINP